jgi:hypothetical protein
LPNRKAESYNKTVASRKADSNSAPTGEGTGKQRPTMTAKYAEMLLFGQKERKPDIQNQFGRNFEKSFDQPLAHRANPLSSYQAGDRVLKSDKIRGQMKLCLLGVRRWPGKTSAELAVLIGLNRHDTARRLPSLEHRGLVKKGPSRFV